MAESEKTCPPMRAKEGDPNLRRYLQACARCGGFLKREACLDTLVRISHWLERTPANLVGRIRQRLSTSL